MKTHLLYASAVATFLAVGCSTGKAGNAVAEAPAQPPTVVSQDSSEAPPSKPTDAYVASEHLKPVYFELSKSQLNENAQATLKENAQWLAQNPPFLLEVAGYADPRGSSKRNTTLAERRAAKVREAYTALGIPKERITVLAKATEEPSCKELNEECLQQGRRAETLLENKAVASR